MIHKQLILYLVNNIMQKTGELFGGTAACCKIGAPGIGIPRPASDFEYTVFIQNNSCGSRCLIEGSILLYKKVYTCTKNVTS